MCPVCTVPNAQHGGWRSAFTFTLHALLGTLGTLIE